jgi:outer membrane protein assembly factor BamB
MPITLSPHTIILGKGDKSMKAAKSSGILLLALLLLAATAEMAVATPKVTLSKKVAPPTTRMTVNGTGFEVTEAVDIYFDTEDQVLMATSATGAFSGSFIVPRAALPGRHWVTAIGRHSGLAAQKVLTVRSDWPTFRFNGKRTGSNSYENLLNSTNVVGLDLAWSAAIGDGTLAQFPQPSPVVVGDVVYVASFNESFDQHLYAFRAATGEPYWATPPALTGGMICHTPAVANGRVYVGCGNKMYAYGATTAAKVWDSKSVIGGTINGSSPVATTAAVYVGAGDGKLYALRAATGLPYWAAPAVTGVPIDSSPAVANGIVYVASDKLYAFNATTGALVWKTTLDLNTASSPLVANGAVYIGSGTGSLYAFGATDGHLIWTSATGGSISSSPALAGGVVYVNSSLGKLHAFRASNGTAYWADAVDASEESSPAVANGVVYLSGKYPNGNVLRAFRSSTGSLLWSGFAGGTIVSSPSVVNGMVYVTAWDGNMYAFAVPSELLAPANKHGASAITPKPGDLVPNYSLKLHQ